MQNKVGSVLLIKQRLKQATRGGSGVEGLNMN